METLDFDAIASIVDEYLGDELTREDLEMGLSAFLADEHAGYTEAAAGTTCESH